MKLSEFADIMDRVEETSGNDTKAVLREVFQGYGPEEIEVFTRVALGELFDDPSKNTHVQGNRMLSAVSDLTGIDKDELKGIEDAHGKTSDAVHYAIENKQQKSVVPSSTTLEELYEALERLPDADGDKAREKIVQEMLGNADNGREGKWISYCVLSDLAMGIGWKTLATAFASVENLEKDDIYKSVRIVGNFPQVLNRYYDDGTLQLSPKLGEPFKPMLAAQGKAPSQYGSDWVAQTKYDGARVLIHSQDFTLEKADTIEQTTAGVKIFSRNQQDVTASLPEIKEAFRDDERQMVLDGEVVAFDGDEVLPFQKVMERFRRENNVDEMAKEIPVKVYVFDALMVDGEWITDEPAWKRYESIPGDIADHPNIEIGRMSNDIAKLYDDALTRGHEGVIVKKWDAPWEFDRSDSWQKLKPQEELDLEVIGYKPGTGENAGMLGALELGARDGDEVVSLGHVGTGFNDAERARFHPSNKDAILGEILLIKAEELQMNEDGTPGGLRFARIPDDMTLEACIRQDKDEPDTLDKVEEVLTFDE